MLRVAELPPHPILPLFFALKIICIWLNQKNMQNNQGLCKRYLKTQFVTIKISLKILTRPLPSSHTRRIDFISGN